MAKSLLFLINPFLATTLLPEVYGKISVLIALNSFLIAVLPLGFNSSFTRLFFDGVDHNDRINIAGNIFYGWLILGSLVLIGLLILFKELSSILFNEIAFYPYVFYSTVGGFLFAVSVFLRSYYQITEKALKVVTIDIIDRILLFGLMLFSILVLGLELDSWLIALLFTSGFLAILTFYFFSSKLKFHFDLNILKKAWIYGSPMILHTASGWVLSLSDRLLINSMMTASDVAFYTLPYSISQSLGLISHATGRGWIPRITKCYVENKNYQSYYKKYIQITFVPLITLGVFLVLFGNEFLDLFGGPEYLTQGSSILPILISGFVFEGYYKVSVVKLQLEKRLKIIPLATLGSSLVNIVLNIVLIPQYGILAAAISTLIGMSTLSFLTVYLSKTYILFKEVFVKVLLIAVLVFILASIASNLDLFFRILMFSVLIIISVLIIRRIKDTNANN